MNTSEVDECADVLSQLDQRKNAILERRAQIISVANVVMTSGTPAEKREHNASLSRIRSELRQIAADEERLRGTTLSVPKRELIGRLLSWQDRLRDRIKNPKTPPAERLFAQQTMETLQKILFTPASIPAGKTDAKGTSS